MRTPTQRALVLGLVLRLAETTAPEPIWAAEQATEASEDLFLRVIVAQYRTCASSGRQLNS